MDRNRYIHWIEEQKLFIRKYILFEERKSSSSQLFICFLYVLLKESRKFIAKRIFFLWKKNSKNFPGDKTRLRNWVIKNVSNGKSLYSDSTHSLFSLVPNSFTIHYSTLFYYFRTTLAHFFIIAYNLVYTIFTASKSSTTHMKTALAEKLTIGNTFEHRFALKTFFFVL